MFKEQGNLKDEKNDLKVMFYSLISSKLENNFKSVV